LDFQFIRANSQSITPNGVEVAGNNIIFDSAHGLTNGEALTYQGALGLTLIGLVENQTYYALVNPYDNLAIRLTQSSADANAAQIAGQTAYNDSYDSIKQQALQGTIAPEYQTVYDDAYQQAIDNGQDEAAARLAAAIAVADATAAVLGADWFWAGSGTASSGVEPPTGATAVTLDAANDTLTFTFAHGFELGDAVVYNGVGSGSIDNLQVGRIYYILPDANNTNKLQLAATREDAIFGRAIDIGGVTNTDLFLARTTFVTGSVTLEDASDKLVFDTPQTFQRGDRVVYRGAVGGTINGLTEGQVYYVIPDTQNAAKIQLANSYANAQTGAPIALDGITTPTAIFFTKEPLAVTINSQNHTITKASSWPYTQNERVIYRGTGGEAIIPELTIGATYYVITGTDPNQIQLAATENGPAIAITSGSNETTLWLEKPREDQRPYRDTRQSLVIDFELNDQILIGTTHK
jgi:hypothetical protein